MTNEPALPTELSALTSTVLAQEAERTQGQVTDEVLFADDLLPGVGGEEMSLRQGLTRGGTFTIVVLALINGLDELETSAVSLLAPDIRRTFNVSEGRIVFIAAASGAFLVLGALPMGWLADRYRRGRIIGICSIAFTGFVALSGMAVNALMFVLARFGAGVSKANAGPVHGSLLADTYPIQVRGRVGAITGIAGRLAAVLSPILIGGVAALAGGGSGWRWAFLIAGLPVAVVAFLAFRFLQSQGYASARPFAAELAGLAELARSRGRDRRHAFRAGGHRAGFDLFVNVELGEHPLGQPVHGVAHHREPRVVAEAVVTV